MNVNFDSGIQLLEYEMGQMSSAHKFVSRFGSPGRYIYVYPELNMDTLSNGGRLAYQRQMIKARGFFNKLRMAFNATGFQVHPTSWSTALINMRNRDGLNMMLHVDVSKQSVMSYRQSSPGTSRWAQVNNFKRNGVYRSR